MTKEHLKREHQVAGPQERRTRSALTFAGIDDTLLTKDELERYRKRRDTPTKLGDLPKMFLVLVVWLLVAVWVSVVVAQAADAPKPNHFILAMLIWFVVLFGGGAIGGWIGAREDRQKRAVRAAAYLTSIGFQDRRRVPGSSGSAWDSSGRTYPVTDGMYDPDLYSRRGGRDTFSDMQAKGIDDYETYKNNVEEAD